MKEIDRSKPVMVTGANGYVASWLVKKLLDQGHEVHAAVRNPKDQKKVGHLLKLAEGSQGILKLFAGDLLKESSYLEAMQGCEVVFHTASPFTTNISDPVKELMEPAVNGTENVLNSVNQTPSIKRVVLTSSCAAMYSDAIDTQREPGGMLTENSWNKTASLTYQPYSLSKTLAEKKAWEIAGEQSRWDLVAINMSLVLGPSLNFADNTSESIQILKQMGDGTLRFGAPRLAFGVVDVRDVAETHYRAAFTPH
ncbi:MAG: NAD-dependent epimerase/dehydratase family protein, partial [Bacteroidota bacterium]|nr:NAD-dependent epimerase/dehydratase family protein [Bacteroidota bacterium]MDX5429477.1 NAD-dependent epimerase/dehydratase family protein [Bacteroidota bacterium]